MRVLIIKTTSMGDVIHTLPALTDAGTAIPGIKFDWVVEDSFAEIPAWHPLVDKVIPVSLRRWRKTIFSAHTRAEWGQFSKQVRAEEYDLIIDAQALVKSAFLTLSARGKRAGLDWGSAREPFASLAYQRKCTVNFYQHAIVRMRSLFSQALGYELANTLPVFGIQREQFQTAMNSEKYLVFLHGTTWTTKQYPVAYWIQLARLAEQSGLRVKISGGSAEEVARAERMAESCGAIDVMPRLQIQQMAELLANAQAAIAVDTGFGHLAAALNIPTVSLYGSTNPEYTGALGVNSIHLKAKFPCSPCLNRSCHYRQAAEATPACYTTLPPHLVWSAVTDLIDAPRNDGVFRMTSV